MPIHNLKPFYESLKNKGEINKHCCQNDMVLGSTVILIWKEDLKDIRKRTHKENDEFLKKLFGIFSIFSCHVYISWMNIDMMEYDWWDLWETLESLQAKYLKGNV